MAQTRQTGGSGGKNSGRGGKGGRVGKAGRGSKTAAAKKYGRDASAIRIDTPTVASIPQNDGLPSVPRKPDLPPPTSSLIHAPPNLGLQPTLADLLRAVPHVESPSQSPSLVRQDPDTPIKQPTQTNADKPTLAGTTKPPAEDLNKSEVAAGAKNDQVEESKQPDIAEPPPPGSPTPKTLQDRMMAESELIFHAHSVSFAGIQKTPQTPKKSIKELLDNLRRLQSEHADVLDAIALEVVPDLDALPTAALNFILSIFGGCNVVATQYADEDLEPFGRLCTSFRAAKLIAHKMHNGMYQLRVRYFAGLGEHQAQRDNPALVVANAIREFFTSIFNNPENDPIEQCSRRARTIYITVRTPPEGGSKKSRKRKQISDTTVRDEPDPNETIIAAINFAFLPGKGFYVNWLATSNEPVNQKKYGREFSSLTSEGYWLRRGFALLLLRLANLSVLSHLGVTQAPSDGSYAIVLQARTTSKDVAGKFYSRVGFEEVGLADQESTLAEQVFTEFSSLLNKASDSNSDFIHFIWGNDDLSIFKNTTGTFGDITPFTRTYSKYYAPLTFGTQTEEFSFPFSLERNLFMMLASRLDFFYLPFRGSANMNDFIKPSTQHLGSHTVTIKKKDRKRINDLRKGELNDELIDFLMNW
jgi:hypothetical protein